VPVKTFYNPVASDLQQRLKSQDSKNGNCSPRGQNVQALGLQNILNNMRSQQSQPHHKNSETTQMRRSTDRIRSPSLEQKKLSSEIVAEATVTKGKLTLPPKLKETIPKPPLVHRRSPRDS
jgi:hypothetical protein